MIERWVGVLSIVVGGTAMVGAPIHSINGIAEVSTLGLLVHENKKALLEPGQKDIETVALLRGNRDRVYERRGREAAALFFLGALAVGTGVCTCRLAARCRAYSGTA